MIERFASEVQALVTQSEKPANILERIAELARPLVDDQSWVTPECMDVDEDQDIGIRVFHEGPDDGLLIQTVCWLPGRGVKPHDHQTWGMVIGLMGQEENTSWRRLDDGTRDGFAEIEQAETRVIERGDVAAMKRDDIHSVENVGTGPSMSLHIYGKNIARHPRWEYDPDAQTIRPCPVRKRSRA